MSQAATARRASARIWIAIAALAIAIALVISGCARSTRTTPDVRRAAYPVPEWQAHASPEAAGWTQADLDDVRGRLEKLSTTGFMAVVGGRTLMEYGDVRAVTYLASVRKSILAMLFGNYVVSGKIRLNRTLAAAGIDDIGGLTPAEKQATIRDLLTARSGIYHPASNPGDDSASAPPRASRPPGTYYLYNNWDFNALGTIFEKETGRSIYDALETDLAQPIGMQDFDRSTHRRTGNADRSIHLAYHMNLSTRDMARVGYLMLREGHWAGRQVIPRAWVQEITRVFTPLAEMNPPGRRKGPFGYGYLWWVWDGPAAGGGYRGAYTGLGAIGQHITVLPVLDLVVAHKTRPGQNRFVSHAQYLEVLDVLVRAGCRRKNC